ncbi:hypothetical protein A2774_05655 [Candidatus Roizmanbacteria bacterium RIFCSPHIGHO2_01_FULL_39_12c]|uniref:Ribulose-phosphate 3-epimerase n=1 Tax=Candidatus Roizmanbacteria bacterium RIFCSPHIGHO2_01_FULL_39_12c TaxID=1802031 RepID=A0A1F7G8A9_9BACT|nr:MAG: hypothetical protein A2774_05655 [Candidatus Roizmanbacteria bacterium RIFCSPHIGHO2_01_FULL_39_12c]
MQVIPALLEKNPADFISQVQKLQPFFKSFQTDIADGIFVPNKTVQIEEIEKYLTDRRSPVSDKLLFDFHLMVKDYESEIKKLSNLAIKKLMKINKVFIHFSLSPNIEYLISKYSYFSFAPVLDPEDSVEDLVKDNDLKLIDSLQIMSVHPGYQGQSFLPNVLKKIEQLRRQDYRKNIYLDGGINRQSIPLINSLKYRPDFLCIGSYLTKTEPLEEKINWLKEKVN